MLGVSPIVLSVAATAENPKQSSKSPFSVSLLEVHATSHMN